MKNKIKSFVYITLSVIILFSSLPLAATSTNNVVISDAEHKQIVQGYLVEIKSLQNQLSGIAQILIKSPTVNEQQLQNRINLIYNDADKLYQEMQGYYATVLGVSDRNRDMLLTFNAINSVISSIYSLSALLQRTNDVERLVLLDEYFRLRLNAIDTISIVESILEKSNS